MFQWSSAAPSCGQKWRKRIQKHFIRRHQRVQKNWDCKRALHRPEATHLQTHSTVAAEYLTASQTQSFKSFYKSSFSNWLQFKCDNLEWKTADLTRVLVSIFWCFNLKVKLNSLFIEREPEDTYQEMTNVFRIRRWVLPQRLECSGLPRNGFGLYLSPR